jgi:pimeloyl-ACP methyl ester carboxylesterase
LNPWQKILLTIFLAGTSCFITGSWFAANILTAPAPSKVTWPAGQAYLPEEAAFPTADGIKLKGWFLSQANSTNAVVLLHGVRANRDSMLARAFWLHDLGYNVLLYDARGCGESDPAELSFGCHETRDLLGALGWLQTRGMTKVACIGCSQGAATVLLASEKLPPSVCAVVAEASYASLRDTVDDHFRAHTGLPSGYFGALAVPMAEWKLGLNMNDVSPLREIQKLKAPLFIIGGTSDDLAPPTGTHQLFDAATCEKSLWMVPWAGHADFFSYAEDEYKQRVGNFLRSHLWP